jgi:hypothetical protein
MDRVSLIPDDACSERLKLLQAISVAADAYADAVRSLARYAGVNRREEYADAKAHAEAARSEVRKAKDDYAQHLREHGCAPPEPSLT